MKFYFTKLKQSFCYAWQGIKEASRQPNFRLMLLIAVLVLLLSFLFKISFLDG